MDLKRFKLLFASLALVFVTAGCVTNGQDFPTNVEWIKIGETKREDVRMLLGDPYSVGNSSGKQTWTYGYYRSKLMGKSLSKELKFYWNEDGTVANYSLNSSFPGDIGKK
jgi:outer membrane protein assembly factor BamE (lipoprotein component of BamABCDE complex)